MTKFLTVFLFSSLALYTLGAPSGTRPENVQLTPEAQKIVDALKTLLKADVLSKLVQIFAARKLHIFSSLCNV